MKGSTKHFRFSTVHDTGHMVPSFTPAAGLGVLAQLLGEEFPGPSPIAELPRAFFLTESWDSVVQSENDMVSYFQHLET